MLTLELHRVKGHIRLAQKVHISTVQGRTGIAQGDAVGLGNAVMHIEPVLGDKLFDLIPGGVHRCIGQQEGEFVAAVPADNGILRKSSHQVPGNVLQHLVTGIVAVNIVDQLKVVNVQNTRHAGACFVLPEIVLHGLAEALTVQKTCEGIGCGQIAELQPPLIQKQKGGNESRQQQHDHQTADQNHIVGITCVPTGDGGHLQLPAAVAQFDGVGHTLRKGYAGAVHRGVGLRHRQSRYGQPMIVAEIGQGIDGVPENVRHPDQGNGEAPKNLLTGAVFQEDWVAHRDPLAPLGQGKGSLEGDRVVVDAVLADLGAEAAGHQVQLGPVISF